MHEVLQSRTFGGGIPHANAFHISCCYPGTVIRDLQAVARNIDFDLDSGCVRIDA